jgi:hypothetical protein
MNSRCSVFFYPCLLASIQERLKHHSQLAMSAFLKRNEPEWLPSSGERAQHLCCGLHQPRLSQEHQCDAGTPIEHVRDAD